jgi:hypothetical protein
MEVDIEMEVGVSLKFDHNHQQENIWKFREKNKNIEKYVWM